MKFLRRLWHWLRGHLKPETDDSWVAYYGWIYDDDTGELIARIDFTDPDAVRDGNVTIQWEKDGKVTIS